MKWILTSERLPSYPAEQNPTTAKNAKMIYVLCHVEGWNRPRLLGYYTGPHPRWYDEEDNQFHGDVLAWMELPELPSLL